MPTIAAACVFRDSWELLDANVSYLITQGITDFFFLDHASAADRSLELKGKYSNFSNIRFFYKSTSPFYQERMTNYLATAAKEEGFDFLLIFDADEFFDAAREDAPTLAELINSDFRSRFQSHIRVREINYVQHFSVDIFSFESLKYLLRRPSSIRKAFISLAPLKKCIISLRHYSEKIRRVSTGNHFFEGIGKTSKTIVFRHVPYSSLGSLEQRKQHGLSLQSANLEKTVGQHNIQISGRSSTELFEIWKTASWGSGASGLESAEKNQDSDFRRIIAAVQEFGFDKKAKLPSPSPRIDISEEIDFQGRAPRAPFSNWKWHIVRAARFVGRIRIG